MKPLLLCLLLIGCIYQGDERTKEIQQSEVGKLSHFREGDKSFDEFLQLFRRCEIPFRLSVLINKNGELCYSRNGKIDSTDHRSFIIPKNLCREWIMKDTSILDKELLSLSSNIDLFYNDSSYWNTITALGYFEQDSCFILLLGLSTQQGVDGYKASSVKGLLYNNKGQLLKITNIGYFSMDRVKNHQEKSDAFVFETLTDYNTIKMDFFSKNTVKVYNEYWSYKTRCESHPVDTCIEKKIKLKEVYRMVQFN